uniref:Fibronectin type-III domain-containing protein n=1 Tax=Candidatus Methanophaga sp. ANME-1 ERB7 TaxID=2759913 RepID=A0A7G9Z3L4_9EURY|nr:hypothetical protein PAHOCELH_00009 [Methanosarcinales archaeon ANME-1 ERB7]
MIKMKHIVNNMEKCSILAVVLIISITIVAATPPIPESYWGYATLNGAPAAYGTSITVEVYGTGEVVGSTTVEYANGGYSLDLKFDDPDTGEDEGANEGDKLTWKISGIECSTPAPGTDTATPGGTNSNFNLTAVSANNPPSVTVLYPNGGESIQIGTQVQVSAHATDGSAVTGVTFYYSNDSNWNSIGAGTRVPGTAKAGIWNITWNTNGLTSGLNYLIKAVASDGTPTGEDPSDSTFSLTCTPPSPPTLNDPGTTDPDGSYTVSWSSVSGATSYTLEEDTSISFSSPTVVHSGAGTSKYITGKSGGTYYYHVKVCNACGCSGWSNVEDIEVEIGTVITVDDSDGADYTMIQEAVDNAGSGYTIKVFSGNYSEHVVIDKSLKLIGENKDTTIIVGGGNGSCAHVTADKVEISGFTIMNCFEGVYVELSKGIIIDNNIISDNFDGIYLVNSDSNTITHNVITNNIWYVSGIHLISSTNNTISNNDIVENDKGVYLYNSINNLIYHNNFINNTCQAYDNTGTNSWDNGYPSGGNYWNDYMGSDAYSGADQNVPSSDGIGDIPYSINSDMDNYPLIQPWENYFGVIAPTISNIKVSPTYALPGDSINISADVFDSSGVRWVRAFISKGEEDIRAIFLSGPGGAGGMYTGTWSTMIFTEGGIYNITISAIDTEGNEVSAKPCKVEILLDTEGPIVSDITVSPTSAEPGTQIHISAEVFDELSGVWWVKAIINKEGGVLTVFMSDPDEDGIYTGTWHTTTSTGGGIYNINISATDNSGNEAFAGGPEVEIA